MLEISRSYLPKKYYRVIEDSTLIKLSLFMVNFLPLVVGVLAIQGKIKVTESTAKVLCGIGVSVTLLALAKDICCGCCCMGEFNNSSQNEDVRQPRQTNTANRTQHRPPQDTEFLAKLDGIKEKVQSLNGRLQTLKSNYNYSDPKKLFDGLNKIWVNLQKAQQEDLAAILILPMDTSTLDYIETTITSEEARIEKQNSDATEYLVIMQRIELLRTKVNNLKENANSDLKKAQLEALFTIFPSADQMNNELQCIRNRDMNFIDYTAQLKQREVLIQRQLEKYTP